jgi:putative membrane protein
MTVPQWLRLYLKEEGLQRIEDAVRKAERRTSGEIVPMVVRESAATGHVALSVGAVALALAYGLGLELSRAHLPWGHWAWLPLDLLLASFLGWALAKLPAVRRLFTPAADRHQAVFLRAKAAFYERGFDKTQGGTGILLFVSLADHQAVVLADKAIAKKLPAEVWDEVCEMLLRGARQKDLANGFQAAIAKCASLLEKNFPPKRKNRNELSDTVIIEE